MKALHLTSYFDEGFFGFVSWWRFLWLCISRKASHFDFIFRWRFHFFLWKMKALHLTSYFDEGLFGFVFWWRLHTLTSYFDEGFIFSLKNDGFTPDFIFWRLWLRILTKASHFDFIFRWRFHFFFENEGFTPNFIFWWRILWLRILMKVSSFLWKTKASHLTSYFDEGFFGLVFWRRLHILLISLEPVIVVLTKLTIAARS
jgi:hypothetical protein